MIYSDILTKTEQVRDRLVSAINSKGGSLVSNASLNQCADAVTTLPEGGGEAWEAPEGATLYLPLSAPFGLNPTNTVNFGEVSGNQCATFPGNACFNLQTKPLFGTGDFSVSIWENFDEASANQYSEAYFFGNAAASRSVGFHWVNSTGKFSLNTFNSDEAKNINVQIETKSWHHIAAVYSSGTLKLFVDNALKGYATVSLDIGSDTSTVGGLGGDSERNWAGGLAGLRVYDRALTEAEISTLYDEFVNRDNPGGGGGGETPVPIPQNGLKFYAPLKTSFVAETGQTLNESLCANIDGVVFENVDGVPCAFYSTGSAATAFYNLIDNYASPLTVSYWGKANGEPDCHVSLRRQETTSLQNIPGTVLTTIDFDSLTVTEAEVAELANAATVNNDIVHHYCYTQDGSSVKIFKDGVILSSANHPLSYNDGRIYLEIVLNKGSIGSVRVYNRALSEDEVKILASEFSPVVGELFFTTTKADGKPDGGYMASGTGTLKLQLATGEITELSLTDTNQRAFSAYELSNVRVVSGAQGVTWLSINRIGIDYIDLSNFWSLERLHMPISSSPEIKNLSSCHRLKYVAVGNSALSSAQVDQILSDILASNSHLNGESFSGSIDVSHNAVPTAAGLQTIAQLESVGWSVNYDRV